MVCEILEPTFFLFSFLKKKILRVRNFVSGFSQKGCCSFFVNDKTAILCTYRDDLCPWHPTVLTGLRGINSPQVKTGVDLTTLAVPSLCGSGQRSKTEPNTFTKKADA